MNNIKKKLESVINAKLRDKLRNYILIPNWHVVRYTNLEVRGRILGNVTFCVIHPIRDSLEECVNENKSK